MALVAGLAVTAGVVGIAPAGAVTAVPNQRFFGYVADPSYASHVYAVGPFSGTGANSLVDSTLNPDGTYTDTDRFDLEGSGTTHLPGG